MTMTQRPLGIGEVARQEGPLEAAQECWVAPEQEGPMKKQREAVAAYRIRRLVLEVRVALPGPMDP